MKSREKPCNVVVPTENHQSNATQIVLAQEGEDSGQQFSSEKQQLNRTIFYKTTNDDTVNSIKPEISESEK